jgi:hypothetical protein
LKKGKGFRPEAAGDRYAYRFDFSLLNCRGLATEPNDGMNAGRAENSCASFDIAAIENVAGKQGQRESLLAVIPLPKRLVKWEKNLQAAPRKIFGNGFFVLMTRIDCVPFLHFEI